jgi:hypothetical protein
MAAKKSIPSRNRRKLPNGAIVEDIPICGCTNTQLERGETCGQAICPNAPGAGGPLHPDLPSMQGHSRDRRADG